MHGLHEVQLDWDQKATSYFPKVVYRKSSSKNSPTKDTCISPPPLFVSPQSESASQPFEASRTQQQGATSHGYRKRHPPKWKKKKGSGSASIQQVGNLTVASTFSLGGSDGKRKLNDSSDSRVVKKEKKNGGSIKPTGGLSAVAVEQRHQAS
jgi:hypothetical protein